VFQNLDLFAAAEGFLVGPEIAELDGRFSARSPPVI
jgi:hypothetical protein